MAEISRKNCEVCLTIIIIILTPSVTATSCQQLQCLNGNPCQSHLTRDNTTHAQCLCGGKWAGPRCQYRLHLKTNALTSSSAKLSVGLMTLLKQKTTSNLIWNEATKLLQADGKQWLNYTLAYWRTKPNGTLLLNASRQSWQVSGQISCVLLQRQNSQFPILQGLSPQVCYVVCIESGFKDSCVLSTSVDALTPSAHNPSWLECSSSSWTSLWPSNCVVFVTPKGREAGKDGSLLVLRTVFPVVVCVAVVLSVSILIIRRYSAAGRIFLSTLYPKCCWKSESNSCTNPEERTCLKSSNSIPETSALIDKTEPGGKKEECTNVSPQKRTKLTVEKLRAVASWSSRRDISNPATVLLLDSIQWHHPHGQVSGTRLGLHVDISCDS